MTVLARVLPRGRSRTSVVGSCLMCGEPVREDDQRMRPPHGGWVHRRCATYRTRTQGRRR